jgi:transcriptional regulator with XRE-family HTH domain
VPIPKAEESFTALKSGFPAIRRVTTFLNFCIESDQSYQNINVKPIIINILLIVNRFEVFIMTILIGEKKLMKLREILANNLKENRRKCGISQAKLAEKAAISTQYIAMIELSRQFPSPEVLDRIAAALGIEAHELFAVLPSPENAMERLHKDIIKEIREVIVEVLEKALSDKHRE